MDTVKLTVQERTEIGDGPSRRLRAQGQIPGVVYGQGNATPISVSLDELKVATAQGHNVVLELQIQEKATGKKKGKGRSGFYAVVKELQFHPTRRQLLHLDLHEVDLAVEIEASVPLELVGTPAGIADGGIVDWEHREVTVRALPNAVPGSLEIDVSGLHIGQNITVGALSAPEGVAIIDDPDTMIAAVLQPRLHEEEVAPAEEVEEPQVIGEETSEE